MESTELETACEHYSDEQDKNVLFEKPAEAINYLRNAGLFKASHV